MGIIEMVLGRLCMVYNNEGGQNGFRAWIQRIY